MDRIDSMWTFGKDMDNYFYPDISCCIQRPGWEYHFEIFSWCKQHIGDNDYTWRHENVDQITLRYFFTNLDDLTRFKLVWM